MHSSKAQCEKPASLRL